MKSNSLVLSSRCTRCLYRQDVSRAYISPPSKISLQCRSYARRRLPSPAPFESGGFRQGRKQVDEREEAKQRFKAYIYKMFAPKKIIIFGICSFGIYQFFQWMTDPARSPILDSRNFSPFLLESRVPLSDKSDASILKLLSVPAGQKTDSVDAAWRTGVWSVQVMQPDLQIARAYTPLPPPVNLQASSQAGRVEKVPKEMLRLLVRQLPPEVRGEVSTFLHSILPGTLVHMRGPSLQFEVPDDVDEIVFLAGGTGIAPALQVAYCLYHARPLFVNTATGQSSDRVEAALPRMKILWANRGRSESKQKPKGVGRGMNESKSGSESVAQWRQELWTKIRGSHEQTEDKSLALPIPTESPAADPQTVCEVEALVDRSGARLSVEYYIDEDSTYIDEKELRRNLQALEATSTPGGKKLILVAGSDGFVAHMAGPKIWQGGREVPGPLSGLLGKIAPKGWKIWTL